MGLIKSYLKVPLGRKLLTAFFLGIFVGGIFWWYGSATGNSVMEDVALAQSYGEGGYPTEEKDFGTHDRGK